MVFHRKKITLSSVMIKTVSVWDWHRRLARFSAGNPHGSKSVTFALSMKTIKLLMTGSSDGVISVLKLREREEVELVRIRALTDLVPSIMQDWCLTGSKVGDVSWSQVIFSVIRVWRGWNRAVHCRHSTRSESCVTSLTSDQVEATSL